MSPESALLRALEIAKKGYGAVSPNPPVGCVILDKDFNFLSEGFHKKIGGPHAEIEALNQIKDESQLKGAHFFVTLEPCSHVGKTGSCAQALAKLPIASVTVGCKDPNPIVSGRGLKILKEAGIKTSVIKENLVYQQLIEIFEFNMLKKSCYVALKVATSLDGQMAMANGESQWITDESSRHYSHELRSKYDAVLVGRGTLEADKPRLDIRGLNREISNKVIILDPQAKCVSKISEMNICKVRPEENIFIVVNSNIDLDQSNQNLIFCDYENGSFDLKQLRQKLFSLNINSIFVEGGALTHSSFLKQQEFNKLYNFIAPKIIGAANGMSWTKGLTIPSLSHAISLNKMSSSKIEQDFIITAYLNS